MNLITSLIPRDVAPLFRPLLRELISLLRGLGPRDWERQTVAVGWRVRDVAAHLLDVELRKIAAYRDDHDVSSGATIESDRDLSRLVNGLNAGGVAFAARLRPPLIVDLLEVTGAWAATSSKPCQRLSGRAMRSASQEVRITELDGCRP